MHNKYPIKNALHAPTTFINQLTGLRGIAALWGSFTALSNVLKSW